MTNPEYLKCPGSDPVSKAVPEVFVCPECDTGIEIWTDEVGGKCTSCNIYFKKVVLTAISDTVSKGLTNKDKKLMELIQKAHKSGASNAMIVSSKDIIAKTD